MWIRTGNDLLTNMDKVFGVEVMPGSTGGYCVMALHQLRCCSGTGPILFASPARGACERYVAELGALLLAQDIAVPDAGPAKEA